MDDPADRLEDQQVSAGGVLYKKNENGLQICLIAKRHGRVWALPKGRVNPGETPEQTAQREVLEETGHLGEISHKIDEIDYHFYWKDNNTLYHKIVTFYLMPLRTENAQPRDSEADEVAWCHPGEAFRRLSYLNEKEIVRKAQRLLRNVGPT
jgi:8-oxo-dGTP pyrophosphatase MutT (NUDIX family)